MKTKTVASRFLVVGLVLALATLANGAQADVGDDISTALVTGLGSGPGTYTMPIERLGDGSYGANDVDLYRIEALRGQIFTAIASYPGSGVVADTILRLFDASGRQVALNDDTVGQYSRIDTVIPETGTYYVGVSEYGNFFYDPNVAGSGAGGIFDGGGYRLDVRLQGDVEDAQGSKPKQFLRGHAFWNQTTGVPFDGNFINEVSIIAWIDTGGVAHGSATWIGGFQRTVPGKGGRTLSGYPWIADITRFVRVANTVFVEGVVTQSGQSPSDVGRVVQWIVDDLGTGASEDRDMVNGMPIEGGNFTIGP
jgi:hypothetical protein